MSVTAQSLKRVLIMLDHSRFVYLLKGFLGRRKPEEIADLQPKDVLKLGLFDWLTHVNVDNSQQERIVTFFDELIDELADCFEHERYGFRESASAVCMTVIDGRYVFMQSHAFCTANHYRDTFDIEENAAVVRDIPRPGVTYISCDTLSLYHRMKSRLKELGGGTDATTNAKAAATG